MRLRGGLWECIPWCYFNHNGLRKLIVKMSKLGCPGVQSKCKAHPERRRQEGNKELKKGRKGRGANGKWRNCVIAKSSMRMMTCWPCSENFLCQRSWWACLWWAKHKISQVSLGSPIMGFPARTGLDIAQARPLMLSLFDWISEHQLKM